MALNYKETVSYLKKGWHVFGSDFIGWLTSSQYAGLEVLTVNKRVVAKLLREGDVQVYRRDIGYTEYEWKGKK